MGRPTRVLVIGDRIPDPSLGGGHGRVHDALLALASDPSLQVSFHPRLVDGSDASLYTRYGIRIIVRLDQHLDTAGVTYDAVVLSKSDIAVEYLDLIRERLPDAAVIYDAGPLAHRRVESQLKAPPLPDPLIMTKLEADSRRLRELETSLFEQVDHTVCVCEAESDLARSVVGDRVTTIEPWLSGVEPTNAGFSGRTHIGLATGWLYGADSANVDGLLWLAREVLPLVRAQLPWIRLLVTGSSPPVAVSWLQSDMVRFVGSLADLTPFYENVRVVVVPVQFGSGIKVKAIESIQRGVPTVSTSQGASGLDPQIRRALAVADDPRRFAAEIIELMTNPDRWQDRRSAALAARGAIDPCRRVEVWPSIVRRSIQEVAARQESR